MNNVRWWGNYSNAVTPPTSADDFTIRFFLEDGSTGNPQVSPFQEYTGISGSRLDSGFLHTSVGPVFQYDFNLPSQLDLNAQDYWISIVNNTASTATDWSWTELNEIAPRWNRSSHANAWNDGPVGQLAYQLNDELIASVPEPSTIILAGLPMLMGLYRRFRKRPTAVSAA